MDDEDMADAIMESMPAVDWSEIATTKDVDVLGLATYQRKMVLLMSGFVLTIWISLLVA